MPEMRHQKAPSPEVSGALRLLADARSLDLEVLTPRWRRGVLVNPKASDVSLTALYLAAQWLLKPRASRPELVYGVDPLSGAVAVRVARVLGAASVVWTGSMIGLLSSDIMCRADDVWALDDRSAQKAGQCGIRAYRALLAPLASAIAPGPPHPAERSICVILGENGLTTTVIRGLKRAGRGVRVVVVGSIALKAAVQRSSLNAHFVSLDDVEARTLAIYEARAVMVPDPEPVHSLVVEALLRGRLLIVPVNRPPRCFTAQIGISYDPFRAESVADALAELWVTTERRRVDAHTLRRRGEEAALEHVISGWIERTHMLLQR